MVIQVAKTGPGTSTVTAPVVQSIKDDVMQCPAGIGALCAKCGFVSRFYNCTRCGHKIIDGQLVDVFGLINGLAFQPTAPTTDKASGATSDNRYLPSPLTASKSEECRTVPLADKEVGGKASELMVLPDTRRLRPKKRCRPTRTDIEAVEDKDDYHDPSANVTTMVSFNQVLFVKDNILMHLYFWWLTEAAEGQVDRRSRFKAVGIFRFQEPAVGSPLPDAAHWILRDGSDESSALLRTRTAHRSQQDAPRRTSVTTSSQCLPCKGQYSQNLHKLWSVLYRS